MPWTMVVSTSALLLFIAVVNHLHTFFTGAMCAAGVLNVNPFGHLTLAARTASFLCCGIWLVINHVDLFYFGSTAFVPMLGWLFRLLAGCERQAPEYPIVVPDADRVNIRLAAVNNGGVHFFTYKQRGEKHQFFRPHRRHGQIAGPFRCLLQLLQVQTWLRAGGKPGGVHRLPDRVQPG